MEDARWDQWQLEFKTGTAAARLTHAKTLRREGGGVDRGPLGLCYSPPMFLCIGEPVTLPAIRGRLCAAPAPLKLCRVAEILLRISDHKEGVIHALRVRSNRSRPIHPMRAK